MPRTLHLLALALCALLLTLLPAAAFAAQPPVSAHVASDEGDDPGDDWGDEGECVVTDEDGNVLDEPCWDDEDDLCAVDDGEWDDVEAVRPAGDDDEWGDDEDLGDDWDVVCDEEEAEELAPPRLSALHAAQERRSRLKVSFKLDRDGSVSLALVRIGGSAAGNCGRGARAAGRRRAAKPRRGCVRSAAPRGTVSVAGVGGANATTLRRWNGQRLAPGSYRLTATPTADGARAATTTFTLRAPARRR